MRIVLFTDTFLPNVNGVVTATVSLVRGLAKRGHEITVVMPKFDEPCKYRQKNVHVIQLPSIENIFHKDYRTTLPFDPVLLRKIQKIKPHLIHIQTPWTVGMLGVMASKFLKVPLVGTFHTFFSEPDYLKNFNSKLSHPIFQKAVWDMEVMYYNQCDYVTCPSQYALNELRKNGLKSSAKFISNGIDVASFKKVPATQVKKKYKIKGPMLLSVSRIGFEKNIIHMLRSFNIMLRRVPDATLMLVGDGPQMDEVKEEVNKLGLKDNIVFAGKIKHDTLVKSGIYGACDLFVITSVTETGPITVLEAMANGKPCVGVNATNLPFLIIDGKTGAIVDQKDQYAFADACADLLLDKKLYSEMKKGANKEVKRHNIDHVIDIWDKLYSRLKKKPARKKKKLKIPFKI